VPDRNPSSPAVPGIVLPDVITTAVAAEVVLLPAASVTSAWTEYVPADKVPDTVIDHGSAPKTAVVPIVTPSISSATTEPGSAVPLKVGVVSVVMLSVLDAPVSELATRSGAVATGAAVSMTTVSAALAGPSLPATSSAMAVIEWVPSDSVKAEVKVQAPVAPTVTDPTEEPSTSRLTKAPGTAPVPVKVGVWSLVTLSLAEVPVSEDASRSGVPAVAGPV